MTYSIDIINLYILKHNISSELNINIGTYKNWLFKYNIYLTSSLPNPLTRGVAYKIHSCLFDFFTSFFVRKD